MMNGVWFDDTHSYDDLNMVLSKVDVPPAEAKTSFVEIPGGDGSVDLTEALGRVRYMDRAISLTFSCFPEDDFEEKKREVAGLLNGRRMRIVLDKDPEWYWDGRCGIDSYASNRNVGQIVVTAVVKPYKYRLHETRVAAKPGTDVERMLPNSGTLAAVPTITATDTASVTVGGETYALPAGTSKLLALELPKGVTKVSVTSKGTTTFSYREGDL